MPQDQSRSGIGSLIKGTLTEFSNDGGGQMAAALSYYTVFSLPPLLLLVMLIAGVFADPQQLESILQGQVEALAGAETAQQVQTMLQRVERPSIGGTLTTILGLGALVLGATGAFVQLQQSLNQMWEVAPDPEEKSMQTVLRFVTKRVLSFGMVVVVAFLLLVALVVSAVLAAFGSQVATLLPDALSGVFLQAVNTVLSLMIFTVIFASIFKILPDARIPWKEVWIGSFVTAVLFVIGKFLIGYYIGQSNPGSAFGAAGSLAIVLVWIYYSSMILFLGAEFTQVHVQQHGYKIEPEPGAVRVINEQKYVH